MSPKLAKALFVVASVGCALAIVKFLATSTRHETLPYEASNTHPAAEVSKSLLSQNVENKTARSITSTGTVDGTSIMPTSGATKSVSSSKTVERWKLIMKENRLPLISPGSLRLTEAAVALMELSPEQAQSVNLVIEKFLDRLRAEEIAHAYVSVAKDGNEQIVVRPFDRTKIIEAFRNELQTAGGGEVARFIADRSTSNYTLAAGNWEMRAYIENTPDGKNKEVFCRAACKSGRGDQEAGR